MALKVLLTLSILLIPASAAFAWGPLTHVYLGSEVFYLGALLPASVYELIKRYRQDFLYGNLMADMIIGKKLLPRDKNPHNWDIALRLQREASTESEKAFVLGYLSHLAADTVAHGDLTGGRRHLGHTVLEIKADSIVDKKHWFSALSIGAEVQRRNDIFMERSFDMLLFSFKTNKRIFRAGVVLSGLNRERLGSFIDRAAVIALPTRHEIEALRERSLDRVLDVLQKGKRSRVLKEDPIGEPHRPRLLNGFLL